MTSYREDIDWLRAIAVLSVIAFHFEAPGIFGGFVGVDIFFVISGYLITGIIQGEIAQGRFSLARFYERRVRRLLPALYVMVALSAIPTFHFLLSSERMEFFRSAAAVVSFTANIFFWWQSGYFDHAAVEKPLLHTWSLGVEEQFYLVLPLVVWGVVRLAQGRRVVLPFTLAALAVASFAFSLVLMRDGASATAFFMSPPRAWEFLAGSLVAMPGMPAPWPGLAQRSARGLSLLLMAIPILSLRPGPGFPGLDALSPCIGAALFIWSGIGVANGKRSALSPLTLAQFFGRISYSLYLWHWPLFAFARFAKPGLVLDGREKAALFAVTVAVSYLSWRFVEQPFRNRALAPTPRAAFSMAALASLLLLVGTVAGLVFGSTSSEADRAAARLDAYNDYDMKPVYRYGTCFTTPDGRLGEACLAAVSGKTNLLLWGDSLAAHYYHGLNGSLDRQAVNIMQATQPSCMPTLSAETQALASCRAFAAQMRDYFGSHKPDLVVMSADWLEYARPPRFAGMVADLKHTIARLNDAGIPIVLLGPAIQYRTRLPSMLARAELRGLAARPADFVRSDIFELDRAMREALPTGEALSYISILESVCSDRQCPLTVDGVPLAFDHAHLTAEGSAYVMARVAPSLKLVQP
ncbi:MULTISPECIES: acyltransferase family protein [unclassified Bradyrhizobium]|uniref:acyltransferase family protein n=1 Tax=unclassified Bradyrhizobium TaxID=2631580 RepID=UPI0028F00886|nr:MULTISPECIES: acyltransferase family protein [unclassified Bradyrhizobium]